MCCANTVLDMTLSSAQGPKNKMPPACLWVTCTELGDSHSMQGLGLHKSRCTWACKWAGQTVVCRVQLLTYKMPVSPGLVVRKGCQRVIWSVRKDQPLRNRAHCRGAEWLLYIINQPVRLTLEHLISEKTKPCWRGREDHIRAVEETNWLSFWQQSVISLKWAATSQCNPPHSLISWINK